MRKITIILPHYNRQWQLKQTLDSIEKSRHDNFDVIVIDDASKEAMPDLNFFYKFKINHINIQAEEKKANNWAMSMPQMNRGFKMALDNGCEIIIIQNAECKHHGDVLMYAEENLTDENYISFGCFSLSRENTFNPCDINLTIETHNVCAVDDAHDSWYNHPIIRGVGYEFCSSITRDNMIKLNGYDERYCHNYCYGDDDLKMRIERLGLKIKITDNPIVLHQWHGDSYGIRTGVTDNAKLFSHIMFTETGYKAKHLYTEDFA